MAESSAKVSGWAKPAEYFSASAPTFFCCARHVRYEVAQQSCLRLSLTFAHASFCESTLAPSHAL